MKNWVSGLQDEERQKNKENHKEEQPFEINFSRGCLIFTNTKKFKPASKCSNQGEKVQTKPSISKNEVIYFSQQVIYFNREVIYLVGEVFNFNDQVIILNHEVLNLNDQVIIFNHELFNLNHEAICFYSEVIGLKCEWVI